MSDIWSCNRNGDNGQQITTSLIYLARWKFLSWSHLDKNMIKHGRGMIQWCILKYLVIYDHVTKVRLVDKNCPPLKFVGQHGHSCLGHKWPKMQKKMRVANLTGWHHSGAVWYSSNWNAPRCRQGALGQIWPNLLSLKVCLMSTHGVHSQFVVWDEDCGQRMSPVIWRPFLVTRLVCSSCSCSSDVDGPLWAPFQSAVVVGWGWHYLWRSFFLNSSQIYLHRLGKKYSDLGYQLLAAFGSTCFASQNWVWYVLKQVVRCSCLYPVMVH